MLAFLPVKIVLDQRHINFPAQQFLNDFLAKTTHQIHADPRMRLPELAE
ncbi:hypothetical protein SRABI106_02553 [Rahnella aquatilis]|nr:hypothetical protein SRABI106_02553 [Rahnella aquatilis]